MTLEQRRRACDDEAREQVKRSAQIRVSIEVDLRPREMNADVIARTIVIGHVELREECVDGRTVAGGNEPGEARLVRGEVWFRHVATMCPRRPFASDRARQAGDREDVS
jgi:hypothetical protein